MKGILGTKVGMTQVFEKNGCLIPVTILHVEENQVVSVKTKEKDGYDSTLIGFKKVSEKKINSPQKGLFKKNNVEPRKILREIRGMTGYSIGQILKITDLFQQGQCIDIQGITKGHGFTGAIKRWNFKIGPLGHGAGYPHRFQGSVQTGRGGSQAQRVFKGKKMSGHYGHEVCTIQNLSIVAFKPEENIVLVKGAVPGPSGQVVRITTSKKQPNKVYTYDLVDINGSAKTSVVDNASIVPENTKDVGNE
ncbi:50S ribosomal protein L3 [Mycoplasmoides alvi]|uniref:50S ribosomal protein L3 n=1 Tax=Mycoplasmoides alvi TaxID=78580 RepID=UPI000B2F058E|nr:50S ribosomal protein L3 [Mycoplasmoides alvi]